MTGTRHSSIGRPGTVSGLAEASAAVSSSSSLALTSIALEKIGASDGEGARCFTRIYADRAMQLAKASDALRAAGVRRSPIEGLTVSIKDLFDVGGERTLAGSQVLRDTAPALHNAAVVERLLGAGAVLIGKTSMTEFAYSGLGLNPHIGTPANPWDRSTRRIPGGSSSGAAVAVADGMCVASIGSDTGGSVRIPAALCGLTGFKPTARRISTEGMLPLSPTLDSVGVIAADVAGCAALDSVLSGRDEKPPSGLRQARFIVPVTLVQDGLDAHVARAFGRALSVISAAGAEIVERTLPELSELADINSAGGFTAVESWAWHADWIERSADHYDPRVLSRILRGRRFSARDYLSLVQRRGDWQCRIASSLTGFDAMLMPTVPFVAPTMAALEESDALYSQTNGTVLRNPSVINFLDGCAISLPCHLPDTPPVGLMLAGMPMRDSSVLRLAAAIEACLQP